MIVSLTTSLLFLHNPNQDEVVPDCNETCSQLNETEPEICVVDCAELEESGLELAMVSVVTISASCILGTTASCILDASFKWLRSPVTTAVALNASMVSVSQVVLVENRSVAPRSGTGARLHLSMSSDDAQLQPSVLGSEPELQLLHYTRPIADPRRQDDEPVAISAVPRPFICAVVPIAVAVALGLFGIWMIYHLLGYLGPENMKIWLVSWLVAAATSFVTTTIIVQPFRVLADAVLLRRCWR
eukprot:COSAG02_NODE_9869_length_2087_cov_0.993964_1_plen_244_part_00